MSILWSLESFKTRGPPGILMTDMIADYDPRSWTESLRKMKEK